MIVQNVSVAATGRTDISFTLPKTDGTAGMGALAKIKDEVGFEELLYDDHVGKVSLIGAGMRSHPGVAALMFRTLADEEINLRLISTSPIKVTCLIPRVDVPRAVRALHGAFSLGAQ
jgi:aspartate kinase